MDGADHRNAGGQLFCARWRRLLFVSTAVVAGVCVGGASIARADSIGVDGGDSPGFGGTAGTGGCTTTIRTRASKSAFQTLPGASFVVDGAAAPRNSALTSAVAEWRLLNGVTLIAKADGEFSSRSTTYAGTGTLKYAW